MMLMDDTDIMSSRGFSQCSLLKYLGALLSFQLGKVSVYRLLSLFIDLATAEFSSFCLLFFFIYLHVKKASLML